MIDNLDYTLPVCQSASNSSMLELDLSDVNQALSSHSATLADKLGAIAVDASPQGNSALTTKGNIPPKNWTYDFWSRQEWA
jgi:hypothetical protein